MRRQSLRKRMEYNRDIVAGNAKNEVEDMARQYPEYAQEILDMVSKYEDWWTKINQAIYDRLCR